MLSNCVPALVHRVQDAQARARIQQGVAAGEAGIVEGVEDPVHGAAQKVAGRHGARQRAAPDRSLPHPVLAQGDAEIIVVIGDADMRGHVDQPAQPHRGIDHDPAQRLHRLVAVALQHVIGQHDGLMQVGGEIVHALARRLRHHGAVAVIHRTGDIVLDPDVKGEDVAVGGLPGIMLGRAAPRWACCSRSGRSSWPGGKARERADLMALRQTSAPAGGKPRVQRFHAGWLTFQFSRQRRSSVG